MTRRALALLLLLCWAAPGRAQDPAPETEPAALTGTLKRIAERGTVTVGYRTDALPFAFDDAVGEPAGYAVDLCREVVDDLSHQLGRPLATVFKPVTTETRFPLVINGEVDIECGTTTSDTERRRRVAFSPVFFVAATKLLVPRGSPVRSYRDLAGKVVAVAAGTTNEAALRALARRLPNGFGVVTGAGQREAFELLRSGQAAAYAADDVLLTGRLAAEPEAGRAFRITGEALSFEPYGLMFARDDAPMAAAVERTFKRLAAGRQLENLYTRWFLRRLPGGGTLNLPISPQLDVLFGMLGQDQ